MPTPIGTFLNSLALKAGVAVDNEHLKNLLAAPELINVQVPDELITQMDSGLLNIDAAKNNHPDIKKKYFADAYDGMDKHLATLLTEDTLTADDITEIKAEKSTAKKIELAITKLKAAKKADPSDKDAINKQLADLHAALKAEKDAQLALTNTYETKIKDIHKKAALTSQFANFKTIYDDLPAGVKNTSLEAMINQALQDNDAELRVDDNGTLQLVKKDGSNVFGSNHVQLTPQSFLDKTFAPILKVSGPPKAPQNPPPPVPGQPGASNGFLQGHTAKTISDLEKGQATLV